MRYFSFEGSLPAEVKTFASTRYLLGHRALVAVTCFSWEDRHIGKMITDQAKFIAFATFFAAGLANVVVTDNPSENAKVSYAGEMLIRAYPATDEQKELINSLEKANRSVSVFFAKFLDGFDIHLHVNDSDFTETQLRGASINYTILFRDQQELIDSVDKEIEERRVFTSGTRFANKFDVFNYHTNEEIEQYLMELNQSSPLVTTSILGQTHEGRNILLAAVSTDASRNKPIVFLDCTIHAREWLTTSICLWILDTLTTNNGTDKQVTKLLDVYDWYIKPVANPDGYVYTWSTDRLWRKNRVPVGNGTCFGVDLNRNFEFGQPGKKLPEPCSGFYGGKHPFSEPETTVIRDILAANKDRVKLALFVHAFSQLWLSPYGINETTAPHYNLMERVMQKAVAAIRAGPSGTVYKYGSFASVLYGASGTAADYAYDKLGIVHSYTVEVPDQGEYGFVMPVRKIETLTLETWSGIKAAAFAVMEQF